MKIDPGAVSRLREVVAPLGVESGPGPMIGKYRVRREIARGAMGVVYEAEDVELRRRVALKLLQEIPGASEVVRLRFQREAQAAAGLSHPNVLRVFDAGEDQGRLYLVMELIDGLSLREILGLRTWELRPLLVLVEKVARGVAAAHEIGVVHRDLKPANILVTPEGEPKVGDFGLAHWMDSDSALTKTGTPLGTPLYMAPEQVAGGGSRISPATDVYGLGAILYEMMTGRPPHTGENTAEIYGKILNLDPFPPSRLGTRVNRELETICLKALEHDPLRRYRNAREFADDLRRHLDGESILARPPGILSRGVKWARRHRMTSAVAAMAIVVASLFAAGWIVARRRAVEVHLQAGREAAERLARAREGLDLARRTQARLEAAIAAHAAEEEQRPLWDAKVAVEGAARELDEAFGRMIAAWLAALGVDPSNAEARAALAGIYFERFEGAERDGNRREIELNRKLVEFYGDAGLVSKLTMPGRLSLDSDPSGVEAELFRYEEGEDLRLEAKPLRKLGRCPLGPVELPAGSYLVILRAPGVRDLRYPLLIDRGGMHSATLRLPADGEIGEGFIYVPPGPFLYSDASSPEPRRVDVDGFIISRFEVTSGNYLDFLNDVIASTGDAEFRRLLPRVEGALAWTIVDGRVAFPEGWGADFPVLAVTCDAAEAFCRWLSARPEFRARFRLPTSLEWQKAAGGVDGRPFPWGRHFSWSFARGGRSRTGSPKVGAVGSFPKDESPYGVRDMAGSAREWCEGWIGEGNVFRILRGGSWSDMTVSNFRVTRAGGSHPSMAQTADGFRIVRIPGP